MSILTFDEHTNEGKNPCWAGYKQVGTKKKDGKIVPNCVPVIDESESDSVTLNVTISNIDRETADDFLKMFAFMKWTGAVGASRGFKAFFDGDGHFRPKIDVEGVDLKDVDLTSDYDEDNDEELELGFGA